MRKRLFRTHITHEVDKRPPFGGFRLDAVEIKSVPVVLVEIRDPLLQVAGSQYVNERSRRWKIVCMHHQFTEKSQAGVGLP